MRQGLGQSSGQFTGQADYSAFGEVIGGASPGGFQSAYQWGAQGGYRTDGASGGGGDAGLVKVGCRYYDPAVGRFTSRDSDLGQPAYCYCAGDPVNHSDPSGHIMTDQMALHNQMAENLGSLLNGDDNSSSWSENVSAPSSPTVKIGGNPPSVTVTDPLRDGSSVSIGTNLDPSTGLPQSVFGSYNGGGYGVKDTFSSNGSNNLGVTLNLGLGNGASLSASGNFMSGPKGNSGGTMLTVTLKF